MKIESRTIVAVMLTIVVLVGAYFYQKKTAQERAYRVEIEQLKLISEHQALEIEIAKQKIEFAAINKGAGRNAPVINLAPPPEETK